MENQTANHYRVIDVLHGQDKVLKESLTLFQGGTLDFLDKDLKGEVTDILGTEITETKRAIVDKAFGLSTNKGLHIEWEAHVSKDDMVHFCSTNIDLSKLHKMPFTTVIITTKRPSATNYTNPSVTFTPKIINLKERDADSVLAEIERKLNAREQDNINLLEIIYVPLYGSKSGKTTSDLLDTAIKLTPKVTEDKRKRHKLQDLLMLLTGMFVNDEERKKVWEANMRIFEDNPAIVWLKSRGRNEKEIEIVQFMLNKGYTAQKISEDTGINIENILEIENDFQRQPVTA
jgi:hypothetical protein